jgi:hypothetical protein
MHSRVATVIILLAFGTGFAQEPAGRKLYPVDESHLDPSFAEFKTQLMEAIEKRDLEFLRGALADEVSLAPGARSTREVALASFDNEDREVDLWRELRDALRLGVAWEQLRFCAPSVATKMENLPGIAYILVITGKEVSVHAEPKSSSTVIDTLSYDVVKIGPSGYLSISPEEIDGETYPWYQIVTPSGNVGYVYAKYVRYWLDYHACFRKVDGRWGLVTLLYPDP